MQIKISRNAIRLVSKTFSQNVPKVLSKISETATPAIKNAGTYIKPAVDAMKQNPGKTVLGIFGTLAVADDIHQHRANKILKAETAEREVETLNVLQKHEAEIQTLKVQAEKAENLEIINEQLCNAIKKRREEPDGEAFEDETTDK